MEAQDQGGAAAAAGSSSCTSSWTKQKNHDNYSNNSKPFPHSLLHHTDNETKLGPSLPLSSNEDSDEDMFTVPDVEAPAAESGSGTITSRIGGGGGGGMMNQEQLQQQSQSSKRRSRGRNPVDKEYRRLKRLLRNRVSAQQARERKKVYVNDLEAKAKDLQDTNSKLEQKISTLNNENNMLRKVLLNTRPKVDDSVEPKHD